MTAEPPTERPHVKLLVAASAAIVGVVLVAAAVGCWRAATWNPNNNPAERGDLILCGDYAHPAERRDDGVAVCPWGAAFDGESIGRVDDAGRYTPDVTIRGYPFYMDFCETVALAGYPSYELSSRAEVTWTTTPGDPSSAWGPTVVLSVGRAYVDCEHERVYFTEGSDCFLIGRDREARPMECVPEIFQAADDEWAFLTWSDDAAP